MSPQRMEDNDRADFKAEGAINFACQLSQVALSKLSGTPHANCPACIGAVTSFVYIAIKTKRTIED